MFSLNLFFLFYELNGRICGHWNQHPCAKPPLRLVQARLQRRTLSSHNLFHYSPTETDHHSSLAGADPGSEKGGGGFGLSPKTLTKIKQKYHVDKSITVGFWWLKYIKMFRIDHRIRIRLVEFANGCLDPLVRHNLKWPRNIVHHIINISWTLWLGLKTCDCRYAADRAYVI